MGTTAINNNRISCPFCRKDVKVKANGKLANHGYTSGHQGQHRNTCIAGGVAVATLAADIHDSVTYEVTNLQHDLDNLSGGNITFREACIRTEMARYIEGLQIAHTF